VNEPEFRDWATGGMKKNVLPCMIGGKTAYESAIKKAMQQGIRIILHTSLEEIVDRLTVEKKTVYKIIKEALEAEAPIERIDTV